MNENEENPLGELEEQLRLLSEKRKATAMLFYASGDIDYYKASYFLRILRKEPKIENLDLIIDSGGGDITRLSKLLIYARIILKNLQ